MTVRFSGCKLLATHLTRPAVCCAPSATQPCVSLAKPSIIFEHPEVIAINKPPGLPFHSTDSTAGVIPTLRAMEANSELPVLGPLFPLHRLDEVTSGILLLGRTKHAAGKICAAFAEGRVHKCYVALSDRKPKKKQGTIRGDMAKARRGSWKLLHSTHDPAITTFTSTAVTGNRLGLRAYFVKPLTGRTHQIRVAMKSIGVPVLGDTRYADKGAASQEDRTYLHASAVKFKLNGQELHVVCPPAVGLEFLTPAFQSVWQENSPDFLNHEW